MGLPSEPSPKSNIERVDEKAAWGATSVLKDVRVTFASEMSFDEVLEDRRTRRVISEVTLEETMGFIKHVFAPRQLGKERLAGRKRKTMISAGALHPIDVVIVSGPDVDEPIVFSDQRQKFLTIPILDQTGFNAALEEARQIVPSATGHLLLFAGDGRRVEQSYGSPYTLLFRDGGAAAQVCSMAAFAYGYGYCPLGYAGSAMLSAIGPPHCDFLALGLSVFGR